MMLSERQTDHIIYGMMSDAGLTPYPEKCPIVEINNALKSASKRMTGKSGKPEFIAQVGNYLIVVEDKAEQKYQANYMTDKDDTLLMDVSSVTSYAENGALHYAQHIACNTTFNKIFAFGCSGGEESSINIRPIYVTPTGYKIMPKVKDFSDFSTPERIETYFRTKVLEGKSEQQMELELILSRAQKLHEDLRNYASLGENDKPQIVSAILLALCHRNFSSERLSNPDSDRSDGELIYDAIERHMEEVQVAPGAKKEQVLAQFQFIKHRPQLGSVHPALGKSPLKYFTEYINSKVYSAICNNTPDDVLGRFYGEFLSYSGGDGKGLGIVLTPSHITQLMVDLLDIKTNDIVFDPTCGTGGFLIAAMSSMFSLAHKDLKGKVLDDTLLNIKKNQLHGVEMDDRMFAISTTNMILRGDGKSNLICADFLRIPTVELRKKHFTVGLMNPPYSQAKNKLTAHLSELSFIKHLLDSLADGARCAVIVPQSTMVGKTKTDLTLKTAILEKHTLEGVITLNPQTFYGVGTNPVVAVFTANRQHPSAKRVKFFNFKDDGYEVAPHVGLVDNGSFEEKKEMLLKCWFDYVDAPHSSFMVKSTVEAKDEWLHSFYYFNDEIPSDEDFEKTMADYLSFEFKMIAEGRGYLFGYDEKKGGKK